jgi:parallel beta-helix repeat protein
MKLMLISILLLFLISVFIADGQQEIIVGPGESIQDAINAAATGDIIWVESGIYSENISVDKRISLYGWNTGGGDPIIDARNGGGSAITLSAGSDGTEIQGFKLRNSNEAGIKVNSNNNYIGFISANNNEYGVLVESSSGENDIGASIEASTFSGNDYGIRLDSSNNYVIQRNTVSNNNHGIYLTSSSDNDIQGNDLSNIGGHDSYDDAEASQDDPGSNYWDGNRFTNHNSPHKIPGGLSVDYNPTSKKPNIPNIAGARHRSPKNK